MRQFRFTLAPLLCVRQAAARDQRERFDRARVDLQTALAEGRALDAEYDARRVTSDVRAHFSRLERLQDNLRAVRQRCARARELAAQAAQDFHRADADFKTLERIKHRRLGEMQAAQARREERLLEESLYLQLAAERSARAWS